MNRDEMLARLDSIGEPVDLLIIGGGATGLGAAVDGASRGYSVALVEQSDFAKGTSSRSTKLVHGGVRYLKQGNISLVIESLKERGILRRNAPHLVHDLPFIVPSYEWWESPFYGIGLKVYDLLAGKYNFGSSRHFSRDEIVEAIPTIETDGLRGGTLYHDGQFDDARLAINLAQTAVEQGASIVNYCPAIALLKDPAGLVAGARVRDQESGREIEVPAKVVINAGGPFADSVRRLDRPDVEPMIAASRGAHIVLARRFLAGEHAIMIPQTPDGRVLFIIPWHGVALVGTTDTPIERIDLEPAPSDEEIDFILETADRYLDGQATRADIKSVFAGIRPLVREPGAKSTAALSRDHTIHIDDRSGLLTIAGGKWTTYRKMAEDAIDHAAPLAGLDPRPCVTGDLPIHGATDTQAKQDDLAHYGADAGAIESLVNEDPVFAERLHPELPITGAMVAHAARDEMARTVDDVLARRTRALLLDARAAREVASDVAALLARELGRNEAWKREQVETFQSLAQRYMVEV